MGLFSKKEPEPYALATGDTLRCEICKNERFWMRSAQLNTSVATFFDLDWLNKSATCAVCSRCGYVHWFLPVD